jgi:ketosteroid isomerase-like protein
MGQVIHLPSHARTMPQTINTPVDDFDDFMEQRAAAANAYVSGDASPLTRLLAADSPATFFAPRGGAVQGAIEVSARYVADALEFHSQGTSRIEVLQVGASGDIAYWVGLQHATVQIGNMTQPAPMDLRVTEIFRRENGEWRLVHRHADPHANAD